MIFPHCEIFSALCYAENISSSLTNSSTFYSTIPNLTIYIVLVITHYIGSHLLAFVFCTKLLSSLIFGITPYSIYMSSSPRSLSQDPTAKDTFSEHCIISFSPYLATITGKDLFTRLCITFKEKIVPFSSSHDCRQRVSQTHLDGELFSFLFSRPFL